MKKLLCSFLLLASVCSLTAQNAYTDSPGRWRLGLNMGAIWESSDVKPIPGLGGGFNIEKILNKRANAMLGFSLGFRYLGGRTYGLNGSPTYDLKDNTALNGTFDKTVRYDSVPGYFYANHKTFIQEGGLELKMNFPRFEQNTGIIFHLWGGIGLGKFKTWIDAKDKNGNMYDFSSLQGKNVAQSDLSKIFDGSYETLADGSGTNGTIRLIPAVGVGLGFRLSKYVAFVVEHKISFPMTDNLDGFRYGGGWVNDFYHYTAANLIFTVHSKSSTSSTSTTHTDNTVHTNTTGTQTVTANTNTQVTNTVAPTGTPTVTNVPKMYPPAVTITYPHNNFASQYDNVSVSVQLQNITSSHQIGITLNGYPLTHFSFNPGNGMLNFQSFLALGNNYFIVTGTNSAGSANDQVNVIFAPTATVVTTNTVANTNPTSTVTVHTNTISTTPTVTTTNTTVPTPTVITTNTNVGSPTVTPTNTTINTPTVIATTTTVVSPTVTPVNTATTSPTATTTGTATVSTSPQHTVAPTFTATSAGAGKPPVINIINPSVNPYEEMNNSYNVSGSVLNINDGSQLNITVNNIPITQFTFGQNNKMLNFWAPLQVGANLIVVKATNNFGSDTKTTVIDHKPMKPPVIVIQVPASSPFNTYNQNETVNGFVYNVKAAADIKVTVNGANSNFNFNPADNSLLVNVPNLPQGATVINITATNASGTDAKSITFKHISSGSPNTYSGETGGGMVDSHRSPLITMITPANNPFYTNNSSLNVSAKIMYISSGANVNVTSNGAVIPSSFDPFTTNLNFTVQLMQGMNTFIIAATNTLGVTSQTVNVNYTPVSNPTKPNNDGTKPNSGGIFQPKINTGGNQGGNPGGVISPGKTMPKTESKSDQQPGGQPINNTPGPRTIGSPSTTPTPTPNNGGGGRTINSGGGGGGR